MRKELQDKLFNDYPKIFKQKDLSMQGTCMCWGIECGDGWYWLIDNLCSQLQWDIDHNNRDYIMKNKLLRKIIPFLKKLIDYIPGKYNFKKKIQYNPLIYIRSYLNRLIYLWRSKQEFIYIDSNRYPQIEAVQVKEKFGGLRFYIGSGSSQQHAIISFAESLSYSICEQCGSTKNVIQTEGDWIYTRCEECLNRNKE